MPIVADTIHLLTLHPVFVAIALTRGERGAICRAWLREVADDEETASLRLPGFSWWIRTAPWVGI